jgi:hypothetical protein
LDAENVNNVFGDSRVGKVGMGGDSLSQNRHRVIMPREGANTSLTTYNEIDHAEVRVVEYPSPK